jgi:hypothetical protein
MENNILLGATDSTQQYDNSGVFNPNTPTSDVDTSSSTAPTPEENAPEASEKPVDNTSTLLMYGGAALLLYYFFFKKK